MRASLSSVVELLVRPLRAVFAQHVHAPLDASDPSADLLFSEMNALDRADGGRRTMVGERAVEPADFAVERLLGGRRRVISLDERECQSGSGIGRDGAERGPIAGAERTELRPAGAVPISPESRRTRT